MNSTKIAIRLEFLHVCLWQECRVAEENEEKEEEDEEGALLKKRVS